MVAQLPQSNFLHTNNEVIFLDIVYCIIFVLFSRSQRNYSLDNSYVAAGGKLELDLGLPLRAGGILPVALGVQQQNRLAALHHVNCQFLDNI